jgi:hypothetical protein
MRLYISYAPADRAACKEIADALDAHDIRYDQRMYTGQQWWNQIVEMLNWCDGLILLISRDAIASQYCQQEFKIVQKQGKPIFLVLVRRNVQLSDGVRQQIVVDMSDGLDAHGLRQLHHAIYKAERRLRPVEHAPAEPPKPVFNPIEAIGAGIEAYQKGEFEKAVRLLRQVKDSGFESAYVRLDNLLAEAEVALDRQAYIRHAEREYAPISKLVRLKQTRVLGCEAFHRFRRDFPDYDPDDLGTICVSFDLPLLEWCTVPAGYVLVENNGYEESCYVEEFHVSKYPVTNAQFREFVYAPDGYPDEQWWNYSPQAMNWRKEHPEAIEPRFRDDDHPRGNVCWYEAMAFCQWLSFKTGLTVTLPTEVQWQRAARGNDRRMFPWGNRFDTGLANTKECGIRMTTPVWQYANGLSPFGVYDMAGNVWEWCISMEADAEERPVRGGSFVSEADRAQIPFYYSLNPLHRYATIGFRLVHVPGH